MRKIFLALFLLASISPAYAGELSLMDSEEMEIFETKTSTIPTSSGEFSEFINQRDNIKFDPEVFKDIIQQKEEGTYLKPELKSFDIDASTAAGDGIDDLPQAEVDLPYQTRMNISGQKSISVKYGNVFYSGDEDERSVSGVPSGATNGFEMDQELRVRIQGQVGEKITVDVDYDDTQPAYNEDARKISVRYKGDPDEIIQEAAFGDVNLSIPSTEFVGYSKKVFGVSVKGTYEKLDFMAIGSQTKGRTDVKKFTGETTFTKKDIKDIDYRRRKYYSVDLNTASSHLPIEASSLKIYIDDRDASTIVEQDKSTMTVSSYISTQTHSGYFYELVPGRDYSYDNRKGRITFDLSIQSDYVIAVEYEYNEGAAQVGPLMIKDKDETLPYELKNIYDLGASRIMREDFKISFLNLNRNSVELPDGSYRIDYGQGILEFDEPQPFYDPTEPEGYSAGGFSDIYKYPDPKNHYIIYVEYKSKVRNYFLRPNILRESERVLLNGRVLNRGTDYLLDYPSGFLTFLNPDMIDETTTIEVTYDYMPFGGLFSETLVGLRAQYNFTNNLRLGGTMLYNWSSPGRELPDVTSTPQSNMVLDTDFSLNIPKSKYFPLPTRISGEAARSVLNPNTMGKALIDSMESIKQARTVSMDPDSWQIAATPTGDPANPNWLYNRIDEDEIYLSEINDNVDPADDQKFKTLKLNYNITSATDVAASIVTPISRRGVDLSEKKSIELWVKGDGQGTRMQLDFGVISEDADGTGVLKTEDKNSNGTLDSGEDTGWNYLYNSSTFTIGVDNSRLNSNDLNGDGFLDTLEENASYDYTDESELKIDWTGWRKIVINRNGNDSIWEAVKHVRISLFGKNKSGTIEIASFDIVGNSWEVGKGTSTLSVKAVNNYDDDNYVSLLENEIYEDIYAAVGGSGLNKEQALELNYKSLQAGATAYVYKDYANGVDYSNHKKINFLINQPEGGGVNYILQFGAGDNMFTKKIESNFTGWKKFSFNLRDDFREIGEPLLTNIKEIRVGVVNDSAISQSGKVWFNEMFLSDPEKRTGQALTGKLSSSIPGILDFGGTYRTVDRNFQTITSQPQNQDRTTYSINAALKMLPFMPISGTYSESEVITPPERIKPGDANPYLSSDDEGEVITKTGKVNSALNIRHLPALKGSYEQQVTESNLTGKKEEGLNYRGDITYKVPIDLIVLPRAIRGYYRNTDNYIYYEEFKREESPGGGYENLFENTVEYFGSADFNLLNLISFKPSYKKNEKDKEWEFYSGLYKDTTKRWPWSRDQNTGVDARLNFVSWFTPQLKYSVTIGENYNYNTSSSVTVLAGNKDVNRNFDLTGSARLPANKVLPFVKPLDSLNLSASLNFTRGETYENIENSYYVFDKLDQRYELEPSTPAARLTSLSRQNSKKYTANWQPFEFLNINKGIYNMFGSMRTKSTYSQNNNKKETTGTSIENINTTWPDIEIDYGAIDKFYPGEKYIKDIRLKNNYRFKEDMSYANGRPESRKIGVDYGLDCRLKIFTEYDSLFQYSNKWNEEFDLEQDIQTNRTEDTTYSGQVKFVLKKYWDLIARYSQRDTRKTAYNSIDPLTDMRTYTPSVKFSAIIDMPAEIKVPFRDEKIKLANKLRVNGEVKADFTRSLLNIDKDNTDKYIFNTSAGMDVSSNIRVTVGTGGQYLYNRVKKENSYFAFHINSDMVIRF